MNSGCRRRVELVEAFSSDEARHLLNLSFAQYQADRDVVKIEARLDRRAEQLMYWVIPS